MQERDMVKQATIRAKTKEPPQVSANYFGLIVEVVDAMPNLTLVRYRHREFLVYTEDLERTKAPDFESTA